MSIINEICVSTNLAKNEKYIKMKKYTNSKYKTDIWKKQIIKQD